MEKEKRSVGKTIYRIIENNGAPWGVGTTAIIAGLGTRLLHQTVIASEEDGFAKEIGEFFQLCDDDDYLFERYLNKDKVDLNDIPIRMLALIIRIIERVIEHQPEIKEAMVVDFQMALAYLLLSAKQTINIILVNGEGKRTNEFEELMKRFRKLQKQM